VQVLDVEQADIPHDNDLYDTAMETLAQQSQAQLEAAGYWPLTEAFNQAVHGMD